MKKFLFLTAVLFQLFLSATVSAQESIPRAEQLVLKDNLLVLWNMGLKNNVSKTQDELCRNALFFLILAEGTECGKDRYANPDFFKDIPENYQGFVPKEKVEEAAQAVFAQKITQHIAPKGTFFNGSGYLLDFAVMSEKTGNLCDISDNAFWLDCAFVEMMEPVGNNEWELFGRLYQFKNVDGEEILWKEAVFHIMVQYQDGKLQIKSFEFTEQAMG